MSKALEQAKRNLKEFGFAPINPPLFSELLEDGAFDVDMTGHVVCSECGTLVPLVTVEDGVCGGCRWFAELVEGQS